LSVELSANKEKTEPNDEGDEEILPHGIPLGTVLGNPKCGAPKKKPPLGASCHLCLCHQDVFCGIAVKDKGAAMQL